MEACVGLNSTMLVATECLLATESRLLAKAPKIHVINVTTNSLS